MNIQIVIIIASLQIISLLCQDQDDNYEQNIKFYVYKQDLATFTSDFTDSSLLLDNCDKTQAYTILVHGWNENMTAPWKDGMITEFQNARGGCVIWMDYSYYADNPNYLVLLAHFNGIQDILTRKLQQLEQLGFSPTNCHIFGFSFGAHVSFQASYVYGPKRIARIDACDPASLGFDPSSTSIANANNAAVNVQCIHTSNNFGTTLRYCQKDIDMGRCGYSQPAGDTPSTDVFSLNVIEMEGANHVLCPIYYRNAFKNVFKLVSKKTVECNYPTVCPSLSQTPDVTLFPTPTEMGYYLDMSIPDGEYYSLAKKDPPYNVADNEVINLCSFKLIHINIPLIETDL